MIDNLFLIIFTILYITISVFLLSKFKEKLSLKVTNFILSMMVFLPYIIDLVYYAFVFGVKSPEIRYSYPIANISPFFFTVTPLFLLLPEKIRKYPYTLISLLSVGMTFASLFDPIMMAIKGMGFELYTFLPVLSHSSLAIFGVYLVITNQSEIKIKTSLISSILIYSLVFVIIFINIIFKTNYFGLGFYGNHNIYQLILTQNSIVSALIYLLGLTAVLIAGFAAQKLVKKYL